MSSDLTRLPLAVSTEWRSKTVTTDPPRLTPHEEWRLAVRLAASVEIRVAVLLYSPAEVSWGLRPEHPASDAGIVLHFFPHPWSSSDLVQINWGWQRITVTDPELKLDPRAYATVLRPESALTGEIVSVCSVSGMASPQQSSPWRGRTRRPNARTAGESGLSLPAVCLNRWPQFRAGARVESSVREKRAEQLTTLTVHPVSERDLGFVHRRRATARRDVRIP